jgi:hypothetical protein
MSQINKVLPFGLLYRDQTPMTDRGYGPYPSVIYYDPKTQISIFSPMLGRTEPTTYSIIESTGWFNNDTDQGADDKGTD